MTPTLGLIFPFIPWNYSLISVLCDLRIQLIQCLPLSLVHSNCYIISFSLLPSIIISMYLCSLICQIEDGIADLLAKAIEEDSLEIYTEGMLKPRAVDEYVQVCRTQIWEYGYSGWFKRKESYSKNKAFANHRNSNQAVKHVIYRFDKFCQTNCISFLIYMRVAMCC